jgi:hypothetical protein
MYHGQPAHKATYTPRFEMTPQNNAVSTWLRTPGHGDAITMKTADSSPQEYTTAVCNYSPATHTITRPSQSVPLMSARVLLPRGYIHIYMESHVQFTGAFQLWLKPDNLSEREMFRA